MRPNVGLAGVMAVLASLLSGCVAATGATSHHYVPAHVETPASRDDPVVVRFTDEAARRAGLLTAVVQRDRELVVVPSAALIYDKTGTAIVFVSPTRLTFHRVPVVVVRDVGGTAWLSAGPEAGTQVVTTGANQVWGAEQGVGH